jgi:hypothetical protein
MQLLGHYGGVAPKELRKDFGPHPGSTSIMSAFTSIPPRRELRWDAIRGLLLIVMSIDHVPSVLKNYTEESLGFVSAAEGFIFLSGYLAGVTYAKTFAIHGTIAIIKRALIRACTIYGCHLYTFAVAFASVWLAGAPWGDWGWGHLQYEHPLLTVVLGLAFLQQGKYLDILPMYCGFILLTPLTIVLWNKGLKALLLLASVSLWLFAQVNVYRDGLAKLLHQSPFINLGYFNFFAWQLMFVGGMVFGLCKQDQGLLARKPPPLLYLIGSGVALLLFCWRHQFLRGGALFAARGWIDRDTLGWLRVLNFAAVGLLLTHPRLWPQRRVWTRVLSYLGRYSLPIFSVHLILTYVGSCFVIPKIPANKASMAIYAAIAVILLYVPAYFSHSLKRRAEREPQSEALPS